MAMTATVYLNEETDFFHDFDPATARLREAATFTVPRPIVNPDDAAALCEEIYMQANIDYPSEAWAQQYRAAQNRSLSVGDVVRIGETAWSVCRVGWQAVGSADISDALQRYADSPVQGPTRR